MCKKNCVAHALSQWTGGRVGKFKVAYMHLHISLARRYFVTNCGILSLPFMPDRNLDQACGADCVLLVQNDVRVLWMLGAAIALGYMYQGPPFRSPRVLTLLAIRLQSVSRLLHLGKAIIKRMLILLQEGLNSNLPCSL